MNTVHPLIAKFERSLALTAAERSSVEEVPVLFVTAAAEQTIAWKGDRLTRCMLVVEGVTCCSKTAVYDRLQITNIHVAGDMPDLMSIHLTVLDSDMWAISPCHLAYIDHDDLRQLCEAHPRLAASLWRTTLVDGAIYREWVINVGQRSASVRLAHLLCEMRVRMDAVDLVTDGSCDWCLSPANLADATGLSVDEVEQGLKDLASQGLVLIAGGQLTIHDRDALVQLAGFRSDYLHLLPKPERIALMLPPPSSSSDEPPASH